MGMFKTIIMNTYLYKLLKAEKETLQAKYNAVIDQFNSLKSGHESALLAEKGFYNDRTAELRADLKASRALVREKQAIIDRHVFSTITSIKFTAYIPDTGWKRTEFKLGLGPCGKEVTALHWKELDDRFELVQTCTDGERKEFTYYKKDVAGRLEVSHKEI